MPRLLIKNGWIVDPATGRDEVGDILVEGERIAAIGKGISARGGGDLAVLDATGLLVAPGLIDMHVHLREPGKEEEETIRSGAMAAVAGGITSVACFPNTDPAIDNEGEAAFVLLQGKKAGFANVFPVGAVTLGLKGEQLSEMAGLARAGAVAFSDADQPLESAEMFRRGLLYTRMLGKVLIAHNEDRSLRGSGVMNHGLISLRLGLPGIPNAAEDIMVARNITLARITDSALHLGQMSTEGAVALLRRAKEEGLKVTGEVTPHHIALTEEAVIGFDSCFKMIPPLRTEKDAAALVDGLRSGVIEVIASGHAPHAAEEKEVEFTNAPFGVIGMETLFPVAYTELVLRHHLPLSQVLAKMTVNPARILGLYPERGTLEPNRLADLAIFDIGTERAVDSSRFLSRSRNCPFDGHRVRGHTVHVVVGGRIVYRDGVPVETGEKR
ncbi:MAG: dihydroorotase [Planctomycetes bacterium]|nr:dihydroorotase [Planctomycetota bacterium]